jgi:hypothetical protein
VGKEKIGGKREVGRKRESWWEESDGGRRGNARGFIGGSRGVEHGCLGEEKSFQVALNRVTKTLLGV